MNHRIFYYSGGGLGWEPIRRMVDIGLHLFDAELIDISGTQDSVLSRVRSTLIRAPTGEGGGDIFIARRPHELKNLISHPEFHQRRMFRAIWIIDSCFTEEWPKPTKRLLDNFDFVGYTQYADAEFYQTLCRDRAVHLGWGTDALNMHKVDEARKIDVLRVGRQPAQWDNDVRTEEACNAISLKFHGRPPALPDSRTSYDELLAKWYSATKVVIAHSNLASPVAYGHKSKEYITARWADALACGAVVAGVQPTKDIKLVNWPGALICFDRIDLNENLLYLAEALKNWNVDIARHNKLEALRRLDWRWRFDTLSNFFSLKPSALTVELDDLRSLITFEEGHLNTCYS